MPVTPRATAADIGKWSLGGAAATLSTQVDSAGAAKHVTGNANTGTVRQQGLQGN